MDDATTLTVKTLLPFLHFHPANDALVYMYVQVYSHCRPSRLEAMAEDLQ